MIPGCLTKKGNIGRNCFKMEPDSVYIIPYLSKELNLLGYSKLPYKEQRENILNDSQSDPEKDFSNPKYEKKDVENVKISFNTQEMIRSLVGVCVQLVKDMKLSCQNDKYSDDYDRIIFEKSKLQKQVEAQKKELEKKMRMIADKDEMCRQMKVKLTELNEKVKILEKEKLKNKKQNQVNEDIMKHQKRKTEKDLFELHKILYNEKNMFDIKYLPKNFDIVQEKQPDFKKLWSEVKYSSVVKKEEILKKAICIFQENNELLVEDNSLLKTLLFVTVEEINSLVSEICNKLKLPYGKIEDEELKKIFIAEKPFQMQLYKECLRKELNVLTCFFDNFDEFSFCVDENIFLPLTDIINKLKTNLLH